MNHVLIKSVAVGTLALVCALLLIFTLVPLFGEPFQKSMFISAVVGSYSIGTPVAFYTLRQAERLRCALASLDAMHRQLEEAHAHVSEKARMDQMTGFLNRETFMGELAGRREHLDVSTLLIIDADDFKKINDRFGHLTGDEALQQISGAIREAIRAGDVVGRIGGEEFAVFLPGAGSQEATEIAERIRGSVEALRFRPGPEAGILPITVSIGGASASREPVISDLLKTADRNLYRAKNTGRNRTVICSGLALAA